MVRPFTNWARNQRGRPTRWHLPASEAELVALVRDVRARGERLRVVGAGHSWSAAALSDQHQVSLDRHAGVVAVDRATRRVTVNAGTRLKHLVAALDGLGLALTNLGSIAEQSIAGAIATGTHGTGLGHGVLATQVVALRLVTGSGEVRVVGDAPGAAADADLLDAARVSLGCLGVVSQVTLQCRDAFDLEERSWSLPFEEATAALPELARSAPHVKAWWLPHTGRVQLFAATPTDRPRAGPGRVARALDEAVNAVAFTAVLGVGRALPAVVPALNRLVGKSYFRDRTRVDRSDRVFNVAMPPRHLEMEYGLPLDAAGPAWREVQRLIEREHLRVNFVQEARFVAADRCHLSPAYGRESCQLGAYMAPSRHSDRFFEAFERIALDLGGRPHWGKLFHAEAAALAPRYPLWARFQALRRELDPDGVFTSAFTRAALG
ncbi:MAG: D-arabinono-1,4-lactone oxidase [Myxococcota bacterium]